jgi:hypothetical protein
MNAMGSNKRIWTTYVNYATNTRNHHRARKHSAYVKEEYEERGQTRCLIKTNGLLKTPKPLQTELAAVIHLAKKQLLNDRLT